MAIDLNENQRKAAYYDGDKYLVIEAGPGAGKTRVLIERIKFLINQKKVNPSSLLVITFTHKAAEELKERLSHDIDESLISMMQISTIHAFCRVVLADIGEYSSRVLGDSNNEKLKMFLNRYKEELGFVNECYIRQNEINNLIDKYNEYATFKVNTDRLIKYIEDRCEIGQDYIDFVNNYMDENDGRYPFNDVRHNDSFKQSRNNALYLQIAKSYPRYIELLDEKGFIDFNQLQIKTLDYLSKNPQTIYKNILVDEFQDTDPVQMKIFEILMKHTDSFTVVGDIDQSIYGFRGANKNYFEYLYNNYDDKVYKINLNINYRSSNQIITLSEDYIKPQRAIGAKQDEAIGARNLDRNAYFLVNESSESEAANIYEMIKYLYDNGKIENYNEIAILSRSIRYNNTAKELIQLFNNNKIPYHVRGVPDLFEKPEIKSILTLIHHLIDDSDSHSHKFTNWELNWLNLKAYTGEKFNQILFDLSDETKEILNRIQDDFEIKVMEEEKEAYLKLRNKTSQKRTFNGVFERDEDVLIEIFKNVERPILTNENLIKWGVKNKHDLEFFRKLNSLKEYINSEDYLDSEDTILDIYIKLLTDVCNYLDEDFINDKDNKEELENLAIISNTFYNYEMIDNNKDLKGVYLFLQYNIGSYSTNQDESEGVQLMTVHKSKGLEFPVVILLSLNEKRFPKEYNDRYDRFFTPNSCLDYKNMDEEEAIREYIEEEDRIIFVAMTRAQDVLILSALIKKNDVLNELKYKLKEDLSEIEKWEVIKDIPKGHEKINELINKNITDCVFLDGNYSKLPKTICEKPQTQKDDFLNLNFSSLEDYIECPFKYKLLHDINFAESTVEFNKLRGLFVHNLLETINNRIKSNNNQYVGDEEVLAVFEKFKNSFHFENLRLSKDEFNVIKNDILYYYHTFGKDLNILKTEQSFKITKEFYQLSGIIDLIYKTKDGKIGILDYKNTNHISNQYVRNYIKQVYTYLIGLNNSLEIESLKIYAIKARKMIDIELNQKSRDILLEELDKVSQNIENEMFECNMNEDCVNCGFSNICIKVHKDGTSVFEFNKQDIWGFRDKFYQHLPEYEIIDLKDTYWKDLEFSESDDCDTHYVEKKSDKNIKVEPPKNLKNKSEVDLKQKPILNNEKDIKPVKKPKKQNIKSSSAKLNKSSPNYSVDYFKNLANKIKKTPNFISDRDFMEHKDDEFVPIDNLKDITVKANLKEKGKKLEQDDEESAVKFYEKLKNHKLFINDYYPYRRQCIIYKNKLKDDLRDWLTIEEVLMSKIYLNNHQLIWFENKIKELQKKLDLNSNDIKIMDNLLKSYKSNRKQLEPYQNTPVPIAERIIKDKTGVKLLSKEKYDKSQNLFYVKELGVGYIRREEYEKAIGYYLQLLDNDILYYKYHAYKQFARILKNMKDSAEFTRIYDELKK